MTSKATTRDLLDVLARQQALIGPGVFPDARPVAEVLDRLDDPDAPCPETGITPLMWTIENDSIFFHVLLNRGCDVNRRGTGAYDTPPIELAFERGLIARAESLADRGAVCPPAFVEYREIRQKNVDRLIAEVKATETTLERKLKDTAFQDLASQLAAQLGVDAKPVRGRKGQLVFKGVAIRKLAKETNQSEINWLLERHDIALGAGAMLVSSDPLNDKPKVDLMLVPSLAKRDVVAISRLLTDEISSPLERMLKADVLDALDADYPFRLLGCGLYGVFGMPTSARDGDWQALATRLCDICDELAYTVGTEYNRAQGAEPLAPPASREIVDPILAEELARDHLFWLGWGVDV